jgi:hypothetical protein
MNKKLKLITSIVASSMLLIGLSTSLSSYAPLSTTSSGTGGTTTGTTTTAPGGLNGTLVEGINCSYTLSVYTSDGTELRFNYSGTGTTCRLGGTECKTDDYIIPKNCLATSSVVTTIPPPTSQG